MDALLDNVLRFAAFLRDAGVSINAGRMPDVVTAVESIGVRRRGDVRAAMRSLLIHRHEDIQRFDAAFDQFWRRASARVGGMPLVSMGERPRVTTTPGPGTPVQFDSEPAERRVQCPSARRGRLERRGGAEDARFRRTDTG